MKKLFIGIDFAKEKFDAAIVAACGMQESATRLFATFENNPKGFRDLTRWIKKNNAATTADEWLFCGEDTGSCSTALCKWLYARGCDIWIESPYAIKHSSGIRRVKTDRADSEAIAEYAWRHHDKARIYHPRSPELEQLREIFLYRHKLVQQKVAMTLRREDKASATRSKALTFIKRKSGHLIDEINKAIEECDAIIDAIIASDPELNENYILITSIKGIARQNAACVMIYTDNFKKFGCDPRKIACYYGVAPFGKQSGTSIHTPARTSNFANKLIKALLGQAAHIAKMFNPEIRDYYERLIARGKKPQVALNNVKNKLIRIIVALVRTRRPYDPDNYKRRSTPANLMIDKTVMT